MMKRARDFFSGTGNMTKKLVEECEELVIVNDGTEDLTFTAGYTTWTLKPGEVFDERITGFESIAITATGAYRGYVRNDA
ncbi:hypothetical protein [Peribacillus butanolivorans]|uniref:Uncharacterized protein n=1 Tax=Peribacillus butanolivorans TaxID=421767 RepID=A0ABM6XN30_9BACI|nr:hypothetical protein [Peribacillus butanolivorans]AXN39844.1 hypothetical protein DTO10_16745 [Peribacillus butanolivorans]